MPAGGGSVDRAPDSQRTNASSKLERRKYSFITHIYFVNKMYENPINWLCVRYVDVDKSSLNGASEDIHAKSSKNLLKINTM